MKQVLRFNKVIKLIIIAGDLCILNTIFIVLYHIIDVQTLGETFANSLSRLLVLLNLVYITCNYSKGIILHERIVRPERIVTRAIRNTFFHAVVFISLISLADFRTLSARFFVLFYFFFLICLTIYRLTFRQILKSYRRSGGNSRSTILLGDGENMIELYHEMTGNAASGFKIIGYFAEAPSPLYPEQCPYLGLPQHALPYIQHSPTEHVYCGLPSSYSKEILPIINYCEIISYTFTVCPMCADTSNATCILKCWATFPFYTSVRNHWRSRKTDFSNECSTFFSHCFFCARFSL